MENIIEDIVEAALGSEGKWYSDISSFAIVRKASGIFQITMYWNAKTQSGAKRRVSIDLDKDTETANIALNFLTKKVDEASKLSLKEKMETKKYMKLNKETVMETGDGESNLAKRLLEKKKKLIDTWTPKKED